MSQSTSALQRARTTIKTPLGPRTIFQLQELSRAGFGEVECLPYTIKVLLESAMRHFDGLVVTEDAIRALAAYDPTKPSDQEIPFLPGRVVLQDFTGVPAMVDLAAMRNAIVRMTGDESAATKVNPLVPCDLVIDHSVQVDAFASGMALTINSEKEFERNIERYAFLKWGQQALDNFRVVPPATGIVHQVNLEYLAQVVWQSEDNQPATLYPDSLVGTDSHTTMINGLGVVGWGVGGIEAEAVMLGQPIYMLVPEVVGFELTGQLPDGATATDLVLQVTQSLRELGVVGKFVEFFGSGLDQMPLANRATIANMAPEYGATVGFFPVDDHTLSYLRLTGRDERLVDTVEQYCKTQGLWRENASTIAYSQTVRLDLSTIEPAMAGPKRPQDRVELSSMKQHWHRELADTFGRGQAANQTETLEKGVEVIADGQSCQLHDGAVVIAAITSCTNTSNPEVMVAAGLLARKARARGLNRKPWVKTSLAPGSRVVTEYLAKAKLNEDLDALGFHLVGYGCTTCIGNSGPLPEPISRAINEHDLVAASVLSGNRNFEGRINPDTRANYLASPPLVVAYAIAGTVDTNLSNDPLGVDPDGEPVYLSDLWPRQQEIDDIITRCVSSEQFVGQYANVFEGSDQWRSIECPAGALYDWQPESTYVQEPPFFVDLTPMPAPVAPIVGARCLVKVGDSVTTDHISPAGAIVADTPAGQYLIEQGVPVSMFNSYGSRRGNDRVMLRGTFANSRVRNQLAPGTEGGYTTYLGPNTTETSGQPCFIYHAAMRYKQEGIPLILLAGKDYGMGSSRDWAAKGTFLLGIRAVIAESFERIHRSNLVGMGVLPLCYEPGDSADRLGIDGTELFDIGIDENVQPRQQIKVTAIRDDGARIGFTTICRIDTPVETDYFRNGGILHTVLRKMAAAAS